MYKFEINGELVEGINRAWKHLTGALCRGGVGYDDARSYASIYIREAMKKAGEKVDAGAMTTMDADSAPITMRDKVVGRSKATVRMTAGEGLPPNEEGHAVPAAACPNGCWARIYRPGLGYPRHRAFLWLGEKSRLLECFECNALWGSGEIELPPDLSVLPLTPIMEDGRVERGKLSLHDEDCGVNPHMFVVVLPPDVREVRYPFSQRYTTTDGRSLEAEDEKIASGSREEIRKELALAGYKLAD